MFEATVLSSSEDENEEVYHLETEVITVRVPGVAMKSGKKCKSQFVITAQTLLPHDAARLPEGEVIVAKEDRNFYVGNKRVEVLKRIPAEVFALDDQIVPAVQAQDQVIEATEPMNDEKAADVHVQEERRLPESEKEKKEDHSDIVGLFREQFPIAEQIFQHDEDSKQLMINNAKVQENNIKVFKRTKQALVDRAIVEVHRLWTYNTTSLPTQRFWSAILKVLECIYPNMFQIDGVILLEGGQIFCPPIVKKANLPVMMYRKYAQLYDSQGKIKDAMKKREFDVGGEKISRKRFKLGKGGACPSKYYSTATVSEIEQIASVAQGRTLEKEKIYNSCRPTIQNELRNIKRVQGSTVLKGFFHHPSHLNGQFQWMYGEDLEKKRASFPDFMGSVERYILETHPDKEGFQKELKKIRNDEQLTETQDMGSWFLLYTLERVSLKPRKKEEEKSSYLFNNSMDQVTDGCPCLSRENKRFLLVCDGELLLRDLDLFEAIVSVVQLAYLVDMEYPEKGRCTALLLQTQLLRFGRRVLEEAGNKAMATKIYKFSSMVL